MNNGNQLARIEKADSAFEEICDTILETAHRLKGEYRKIVPPREDTIAGCLRWQSDVDHYIRLLEEISTVLGTVPEEPKAIVRRARERGY